MGATSSCINDIANDDFIPILHIEEEMKENNTETGFVENENMLSIPAIHTSASDNSISNILDFLGTNDTIENSFHAVPSRTTELKSSGSDVSISLFLDTYVDACDENTSANVDTNISSNQNQKRSNSNVCFQLDE